MALLSAADRLKVRNQFMRQNKEPLDPAIIKSIVASAVAAVDQWAEDNATEYNQALPVEFRTTATVQEKALMLVLVVARRSGLLPTEEG